MNPLEFIPYKGETIAVVFEQPNWRTRPKLELLLPFTDVATAISHRETRRSYGRSSRYSFSYTPKFRSAEASTAFRKGLERLKDEPVCVPLWTDEMRLATSVALGDTVLPIALTQAARTSSELIVIGASGLVYEIITLTGSDATTVTIASGIGHTWGPNAHVYPLLFGRFDPRPELQSITAETVSGGLHFREDSPYARKINATVETIATVGPGIPAFSTTPIWTKQPNWSDVIDTTEVDILYQARGFGRQDQTYVYQQSVRRGLEMEFVCRSRAEIAQVEAFFTAQRAIVTSFFIPTFRNDMMLAQDLPIGGAADTIVIEESRFTDVDFAEHPGTAFIAMVDDGYYGGVFPKRIDEIDVDGVTLHLTTDITNPHKAATTRLSHLLLVRFAEPKIQWDYITPTSAKVRLKFIEQPDEYATPQPVLPESAYLYKFYQKFAAGDVVRGYYTSYENAIVHGGQTWLPAGFERTESIKQSLRLDDETTELQSWRFDGNPLELFLPFTLDVDLWVDIIEVNAADPDDASAWTLFTGTVQELQARGPERNAKCEALGGIFNRKFPRFLMQKTDNFVQFTRPTQIDAADFKTTRTIAVLASDHVNVGAIAQPAEYFAAGWFETGVGANVERRAILHSTPITGGHQLTINRPLNHAVLGQSIDIYPGYDGSLEECDEKFDNLVNFGGHKYVPDTGPQIKAVEAKQASGGKK